MSLLNDLIDDASGDSVTTPVLLRRLKVLAARLKALPLADWVEHELAGYRKAVLPDYRGPFVAEALGNFQGPFGSALTNAPIPLVGFDESCRSTFRSLFVIEFRESVAELEDLISTDAGGNLGQQWPADAVALANHYWQEGKVHWYEGMGLLSAQTKISKATVSGVLDTVRTRVLDLALAFEAEDPDAGSSKTSNLPPEAATSIFNTVVMGSGNVAVGSNDVLQVNTSAPATKDELIDRLRGLGVDDDLLAELSQAIDEDLASGAGRLGEPGAKTRSWLGKAMLLGAKTGGKVGVGASGSLVAELVMGFFGA